MLNTWKAETQAQPIGCYKNLKEYLHQNRKLQGMYVLYDGVLFQVNDVDTWEIGPVVELMREYKIWVTLEDITLVESMYAVS